MIIDELPENQRISLLRGYVEKSWRMPWLADDYPDLATAPIQDRQAYDDGLRLRQVLDELFSADVSSEWESAKYEYAQIASELNQRYGEGLVLPDTEGTPGLLGFRATPYSTETTTTFDQEGHEVVSVRDLQEEDEASNQADRAED
jgi:hypothetical protein